MLRCLDVMRSVRPGSSPALPRATCVCGVQSTPPALLRCMVLVLTQQGHQKVHDTASVQLLWGEQMDELLREKRKELVIEK